jgi:hypothetical protein
VLVVACFFPCTFDYLLRVISTWIIHTQFVEFNGHCVRSPRSNRMGRRSSFPQCKPSVHGYLGATQKPAKLVQ